MGGYAEALEWLTAGLELALRTGDPEAPWSSCARCARPAWPRSGGRPTRFSSTRPRGSTRER